MKLEIKKNPKKINFGVTLDPELVSQLKILAKQYKVSLSSLTEQILLSGVINLKNQKGENK